MYFYSKDTLPNALYYNQFDVNNRSRMLRITDERIKMIAELMKSMRIVKMYCWESAFEKKVYGVRK